MIYTYHISYIPYVSHTSHVYSHVSPLHPWQDQSSSSAAASAAASAPEPRPAAVLGADGGRHGAGEEAPRSRAAIARGQETPLGGQGQGQG